jgi:hypothetical protein
LPSSVSDNRFGCLWIALKYLHADQPGKEPHQQQQHHSFSSTSSYSSARPAAASPAASPSLSPHNRSSSAYLSAHDSLLDECARIVAHFDSPYLKALFNFMLNSDEAIDTILVGRDHQLRAIPSFISIQKY